MSKPKLVVILFVGVVVAFLAGSRYQQRSLPQTPPKAERKILYYVDPMHPAYRSDKPGIAPDCGMQLEPVYADGGPALPGSANGSKSLPAGAVQISPERQRMVGVRVGQVEKTSGTHLLRTLGRIALDETRVFRVTIPVEGLVRHSGPIVSGSMVRKDELLATFYNRDFLTAQQTYLYALNTMDRYKDNESEDQLKLTRAQMRAAEENLEFLGMGETQLHEIARTRQIAREIQLRSPKAGLVLARNVFAGLRFDRGTELFRIVELDHVWILADVFENEAQYFRPGTTARVTVPHQQRSFHATVSQALPQFDAATRTLKIRLEVDNPGFVLRPDMFVDVELPLTLPPALTVPNDAILDSGLRKTVFVAIGEGLFEPRKVETGWRFDDRVQILKGLMEGERIVTSGTFLVDSESRLKAAAAGVYCEATRDPVCGMEVDQAKAKAAGRKIEHRGTTYYFCSEDCKHKFEKSPENYVTPGKGAAAAEIKKAQAAPAKLPATAKDPSCGMEVKTAEAKAAGRTSEYGGKTYYFCSDSCKREFDEAPARVLERSARARGESVPGGQQ